MDKALVTVAVAPEPFGARASRALVAAAEDELDRRYGPRPGGRPGLSASDFSAPGGLYLVARLDGTAVGGVGLRTLAPGRAEVKRLWVDPAQRGRGVARRLMAELEAAAAGLGIGTLYLETGPAQPEAVALYQSTGWRRRGPWPGGPDRGSIFFEKSPGTPGPAVAWAP